MAGLRRGERGEGDGGGREVCSCSGDWHYTHSVGVAGARAPARQHNDQVATLEEPTSFANIHAQVDTEVHILCPCIQGWLFAENREDATVEVGLARSLVVTGDGNDGCPWAVP